MGNSIIALLLILQNKQDSYFANENECAYKGKEIIYHPFPNLEQKSDSSESGLTKVIYYQVNWYVSSLKTFLFLPLINFIWNMLSVSDY